MRLIKLYTACICLSLGMSSCADFLEEENRSNINAQEYFVEKDGLKVWLMLLMLHCGLCGKMNRGCFALG